MKIDKQAAQKMREAGHTYKHIAQTLGCSEAWCKQNLAHIVKNSKEQGILAQLISMAQSPNGITTSEIRFFIKELSTDGADTEKAVARIKAKINKEPNTIIRPLWMSAKNPHESLRWWAEAAEELTNRVDMVVNEYLQKHSEVLGYDEDSDMNKYVYNSFKHSLLSLLTTKGTVAQTVIDSYERSADLLSQKQDVPTSYYNKTTPKEYIPFPDIEEKVYFSDLEVPEYFDEAAHYIDSERDSKWDDEYTLLDNPNNLG